MKVWDGTSSSRPDPLVRKGPDGADWKTITGELQKVQAFVVNLSGNTQEMPSLIEEIKTSARQINRLQSQILGLTAPEDVMKRIAVMGDELEEMRGVYVHAGEVLQTVNLLQRQLLNLNTRINEHIEDNKTKRVAFENKVANWQRVTEARTEERLAKLEETSGTLSLALGLKKFGE